MKDFDIICIGGGAASFYFASQVLEKRPQTKMLILERGKAFLQKVLISGGGRCNVTTSETDPQILAANYPRGEKALIGPFSRYGPTETRSWFASRGVKTKVEPDGRVFPVSDKSADIALTLVEACKKAKATMMTSQSVTGLKKEGSTWVVSVGQHSFTCHFVFVGTGSSQRFWNLLAGLGLKIVSPVPSLFTFCVHKKIYNDLMGISWPDTVLTAVLKKKITSRGSILFTHWGLSGPAVLRLSAWGARQMAQCNYEFDLMVDFLPDIDRAEAKEILFDFKQANSKIQVFKRNPFGLPSRVWEAFNASGFVSKSLTYQQLNSKIMDTLIDQVKKNRFQVRGKNTFKEEFVTAGGVSLDEIDFKTFSCKKYTDIFMAGEVLDIDGITGGFNFQAAWTGAWIAAQRFLELAT